jgi:uncharacterized protein YuzE
MKITYDPEVDAMYIQLVDGKHQCRTVCLTDEIALDFGAGETLVGIEILDAKKIVGKGKLPKIVLQNITAIDQLPASRRMEKIAARAASKLRKARKSAA